MVLVHLTAGWNKRVGSNVLCLETEQEVSVRQYPWGIVHGCYLWLDSSLQYTRTPISRMGKLDFYYYWISFCRKLTFPFFVFVAHQAELDRSQFLTESATERSSLQSFLSDRFGTWRSQNHSFLRACGVHLSSCTVPEDEVANAPTTAVSIEPSIAAI